MTPRLIAAGAALLLVVLSSPVARSPADGLVLVAAGAFWMGREGGPADEAPAHRVVLARFWIDRHKITNAEFAAFLDARGPSTADGETAFDDDDADARIHRAGSRWLADAGFEHHPAVEVSWFGARDFCAWRGRRLPTEAEWEKAARGDDGRLYPWGTATPSPELAVFGRQYNATDRGDRRPAGASPSGVEDMLGNLREWTASAYRPYPYRPADGRETGDRSARRVVRGASHDDPASELSVTRRRYYEHRGAARGHHFVGFRCATSAEPGGIATPPRGR